MATLRQELTKIAGDLADNEPGFEFERFGRSQLIAWYHEGACLVQQLRPDLFSSITTIKLQPGDTQDISPCRNISRVHGQSDAHGNISHRLAMTNPALAERFIGNDCPPRRDKRNRFKLRSYIKDALSSGYITVEPPVPVGEDVYLKVTCSKQPAPMTDADLDTEVAALDCGSAVAVAQWVHWRALSTYDAGSVEYRKAVVALRLFFQLIEVKFSADLVAQLGIIPVPSNREILNLGGSVG